MQTKSFLIVTLLLFFTCSQSMGMDLNQGHTAPRVILESVQNNTAITILLRDNNQIIKKIPPGQKQSLKIEIPLKVSITNHHKKITSINTLQAPKTSIYLENADEPRNFLTVLFSEEFQPRESILEVILLNHQKLFDGFSMKKIPLKQINQLKKLHTLQIFLKIEGNSISSLITRFKKTFSPLSLKQLSLCAISSLVSSDKMAFPKNIPTELGTQLSWTINKIKSQS